MLGISSSRRSSSGTAALQRLRPGAILAGLAMLGMLILVALGTRPADAALPPAGPGTVAPDGAGFTITPGDLPSS